VFFTLSLNANGKTDRSRPNTGTSKLVYVTGREPGIRRIRRGSGFIYTFKNQQVRDRNTLARIRSLVIPPAWSDVWICCLPGGHIQATGFDARGRKQYKYHEEWTRRRDRQKFHRLFQLGKCLPALRKRVAADLQQPGLGREKVLATAVSLIEKTSIRIGNAEYERSNGSFGLTTLKDRHAVIRGETLRLSFKGKKGISQSLTLRDKRLAHIVNACRKIPGADLLQFRENGGPPAKIDSGMVNAYIRETLRNDFTAKDLRTWCGSLAMLEALKVLPDAKGRYEVKKNVIAALDAVSGQLGNTRAVCKSHYVHPAIISRYEKGGLKEVVSGSQRRYRGLSRQENMLMKLLEKCEQ
jgi:DNA topoisomerase-1